MSNVTSQSELTTKEIVEQAISDLYKDYIFPHLNGQVPVIANKFDKANLYSTDEQIVGRWIDGKPLYQKVVTGITLQNCVVSNLGISDISETVFCQLIRAKKNTDNNWYLDTYYAEQNDFLSILPGNNQVFTVIGGPVTYSDASFLVQYTKTTDEAIAIGSDTDYSLEEKIVGTDIDDKPIYKKTINVSFTPITETSNKYAYYNDLNVGISNIANIIKCEGRNTTNGMAMNYFAMPSSTANCINLRSLDVLWTVDKLTLWYTKTTD